MSYNFKNFESEIDPVIVKRGKKYFDEGKVTELDEEEPGQWVGVVSGTEDYEVEADVKRNRIKYSDCTCPYDDGPVCKHVVALLFAIRAASDKPVKSVKDQASTKKKLFLEILDNVNYQDLRAFLLELALKKKDFGSLLLSRFAEYSGLEGREKYSLVIKNSISAAADRSGFVDTPQIKLIMKPVNDLLANAENAISKQFYAEAVNICQAIIENLVPKLEDIYDTKGQVIGAIEQAFALLKKLATESIPMPLQDALFEYVFQAVGQEKYRQVGFDTFWLDLLDTLAKDKAAEEQITGFVKLQLQKLGKSKSGGEDKFHIFKRLGVMFVANDADERKYAFFLAKFYQKRNRITEMQELLENYKHLDEFNELLVAQALKEKEFLKAKNLVKTALATAKQNRYNSSIVKWEQWLLEIAEAEKNIPEMREIGLDLYLRTFEVKIFRKVKSTYTPEEWQPVYEQLKTKLLKADQALWLEPVRTVALLTEEKDWPALLQLLENKPVLGLVMQVAKVLPEDYNAKLLDLLKVALQQHAQFNTTKTSYKEIGNAIMFISKLANGKPLAKQLLSDFKAQYKMRRNLMEVLNKIHME